MVDYFYVLCSRICFQIFFYFMSCLCLFFVNFARVITLFICLCNTPYLLVRNLWLSILMMYQKWFATFPIFNLRSLISSLSSTLLDCTVMFFFNLSLAQPCIKYIPENLVFGCSISKMSMTVSMIMDYKSEICCY